MKILKKVMVALFVGAIAISACGCDGGGNKNGRSGSEVTTIRVWSGDTHSKAVISQLVNEYNESTGKEKGIYIDYEVKENSSNDIIDMAIASQQEPELFMTGDIRKYSETNVIKAIEDMPGSEEFVESYEGKLVEGTHTWNGKTYKVPFTINTFGLAYNKDMFKKYGIVDENGEAKPPATYEELRETAKKLTHPENQEYGIVLPLKNQWFFGSDIDYLAMRSSGYESFNPVTGEFDFSHYKSIFDMYVGIKEDKSYFPGAEGLDDDQARAQFAIGKIGMKFAGSYDVGVYTDQFPAQCDWDVAPYPVENRNETHFTRIASDGFLCISARRAETVDNEKLMEAFKWFHSDELLTNIYKEGVGIPYDWSMVENVEVARPLKGWVSFCKLAEEGKASFRKPDVDMSGEKDALSVFLDDVWTQSITTEEAVNILTGRYQNALQKHMKKNPNIKLEDYIDKDWFAQ